jgi:hypothetical protein
MKRYYAPEGARGSINRGTESYPISDGVVAVPADVALQLNLKEAGPIEVKTDGGSSTSGSSDPHPILAMKVDDAVAHIASASAEDLESIEIAELSSKKPVGGRKGVLNAIVERRKQLAAGDGQ